MAFEEEPNVLAPSGFPGVARLELDQLLGQLIERATDVLATQGRLRGLLRANLAIASAVALDEVLAQILTAARSLVDAEYAALGVVEHGRLVRFLHQGMDAATVTRVGQLPEGKGLLGRLIDYPAPLRLADLGSHLASAGFPSAHPPMTSFLGVPILMGAQAFGNLYLTNKQGAAEFSQDDEELVMALAAAAGAAISNATQYAENSRRRVWSDAMAALSTAVLTAEDPESAHALVGRYATDAIDTVASTVCVPADDPGRLRVAAASGLYADRLGDTFAVEGTIYSEATRERRAIVVEDSAIDYRTTRRAAAEIGAIVAIPMLTELSTEGVLFVCRAAGTHVYGAVDVEMLTAYANHAALVLQLAAARRDNEELRMDSERRHLAEDLHGRVIQRVSLLGIQLNGLAARTGDPAVKATLQTHVNDTDEVIRELRSTIFGLNPPADKGEPPAGD